MILHDGKGTVLAVSLRIDREPEPAARPRFYNGHAYTPLKYRAYLKAVREQVAYYARANGLHPLTGQIETQLTFYRRAPKSMTKADQYAASYGALRPTTKPDIDNLQKAVLDACNGILWHDDAQIVRSVCEKRYIVGKDGHTDLEVYKLD